MEIRHWNLCLSDKVHCKHWILALSHEMPEFPCIDDVSQCFSIVPSHNPCLASYKNPRLLKASRRKPLDETPEREGLFAGCRNWRRRKRRFTPLFRYMRKKSCRQYDLILRGVLMNNK